MIRSVTSSMIVASVLSLAACKATRAPGPAPIAATPEPAAPTIAGPELHEIPIAGDGRTFTLALAETDAGPVLFATEPTGIGRHALDLDARTATRTAGIPLDRYPNAVAYERADDRLWWTTTLDQSRLPRPNHGDFPFGPQVLTLSSTVEHSAGLRGTIRLCPASVGTGLRSDTLGEVVQCDHEIRTLLPAFGGVLLGGHLAEQVGRTTAAAWLGFVDASGALTAEYRVPDSSEAWIGALAQSDAGVLAVAWSGRGDPARASFVLLRGPTLEPSSTALRSTPTWISVPWAAAVAAPDQGFWVVLTTSSYELTFIAIGPDGTIAAEHAIEGAQLPISSVQWFGLRGGEPWLLIAEQYGESKVWAGRIDPANGKVPEHHEIPLPAELVTERMLGLDRGLLLAGREKLERPLALWIPLAAPADERCSERVPDELSAILGVVPMKFVDAHSGTIDPSSFAELERIAEILIRHPQARVDIRGHTDSQTADKYRHLSKQPSEREAEAVRDFLISRGVPADQLTAHGYGDTMPLAPNDTAEGRATNHRIELVLQGPVSTCGQDVSSDWR